MRRHPLTRPRGEPVRGGPRHPRSTARLAPESPSRPEIQEEIRMGVRNQRGKIRGNGFWSPAGSTK